MMIVFQILNYISQTVIWDFFVVETIQLTYAHIFVELRFFVFLCLEGVSFDD